MNQSRNILLPRRWHLSVRRISEVILHAPCVIRRHDVLKSQNVHNIIIGHVGGFVKLIIY